MQLAFFALVLATAVYIPSIFFGNQPFDTSWGVGDPCSGFFDCLFDTIGDILDAIGDLLQFLVLTDVEPEVLRTVLLFPLGLAWLLIILGLVRGVST